MKSTRVTEATEWSSWSGHKEATITLREIQNNNTAFPEAVWTLSAPTALTIVALRAIKRIGKDGRATGVQILNTESVLQYTGMAIDAYADKMGNGGLASGMRPSQLPSLPHTHQTTSTKNTGSAVSDETAPLVPERFRDKLTLWYTKMRMFRMNNPTKNEVMVTKEVSQPVISGGPME
ncbi:hypothetical protein H9Q72_010860 [Fusarium xylarioides]|uniref:Uncharacterized protein n=1 Tax=Fusarium xylarioides TaxID=221167 RepID=A0A9P7LGM8_9HYPO|nr:hypothetical protein H9Q70_011453 [Fusarium xylarioides]KAG5761027.1 hypothetical protein H9Q72_010860 [Fusarium xylarioides]KAG5775543.1 hypothetical protein H9Q73_010779 [Fusarium xylarioides]KAG5806662.1 hypothetical protein H9Q71_008761 [Fusarium xylarioides]KAG5819372.1 hypothetical protein H9Q74_009515 [Fusarium xylarioides]